jgi:hypothetical protein
MHFEMHLTKVKRTVNIRTILKMSCHRSLIKVMKEVMEAMMRDEKEIGHLLEEKEPKILLSKLLPLLLLYPLITKSLCIIKRSLRMNSMHHRLMINELRAIIQAD